MIDVPVLVAGGGPVGLATALELQARGVRTMVVERNPTTTRHPKMDVTNGRTMEHFRRLGVAERIRDIAVPRENCMDVAWVTRLNEWELARFAYPDVHTMRARIAARNDGSQPLEPYMRLSQVVLEPALRDVLLESDLVELRFGWAFEALTQDDDGVNATIREVATGRIETIRCALLAGCDGGSSRVREALGIACSGQYNIAPNFMVHFRSSARELLQRFGVAWHYQFPQGAVLIAQDDHEIWTMHTMVQPGVEVRDIVPEELVFQVLGARFEIEVLQANPWSPHLVLADSYGRGRVWLAGDSTHQLIPTGGYGMNTGIGDAVDLAWKFAAVVEGWGGAGLLASIEAERRPVGGRNVAASFEHLKVRIEIAKWYDPVTHQDSPAGAVAREAAGRAIVALGNAENEALGIEIGYRYRDSPIVCGEGNEPEWRLLDHVVSTWPGVRAPHVFLADGTAIFDLFGAGFTLVRFVDGDVGGLVDAAGARGVPLKVVDIRERPVRKIYERDFVLIRPDQHVAWRGDAMPVDGLAVIDRLRGGG